MCHKPLVRYELGYHYSINEVTDLQESLTGYARKLVYHQTTVFQLHLSANLPTTNSVLQAHLTAINPDLRTPLSNQSKQITVTNNAQTLIAPEIQIRAQFTPQIDRPSETTTNGSPNQSG
jgi:hypothetical protein